MFKLSVFRCDDDYREALISLVCELLKTCAGDRVWIDYGWCKLEMPFSLSRRRRVLHCTRSRKDRPECCRVENRSARVNSPKAIYEIAFVIAANSVDRAVLAPAAYPRRRTDGRHRPTDGGGGGVATNVSRDTRRGAECCRRVFGHSVLADKTQWASVERSTTAATMI